MTPTGVGFSRISTVLGGSVLCGGLMASASSDELSLRPWAIDVGSAQTFDEGLRAAGTDADALVACARTALAEGRFEDAAEALKRALAEHPDHEEAQLLWGAELDNGEWRLRFAAQARPGTTPAVELPAPSDREIRQILARFDRDISPSNRSSYFELRTDLEAKAANVYGKVLDRHFRRLKSRFRAYDGNEIDVLVFARRSDYLRYYQEYVGEGGEHVAGFYYADHLVFYDDPLDRGGTSNTATHECTHLLIDRCFHRAEVPIWLHEGMACYFAAECDEALGAYTAGLLLKAMDLWSADRFDSVEDLLDTAPSDFEFEEYAKAWALVHFLNDDRRRAETYQRFLEDLRDRAAADPEASAPDYREWCRERLAALYSDSWQSIDVDLRRFMHEDFALTSPRQAADFAEHCLFERALFHADPRERVRAVLMAEQALDAIPDQADEEVRQFRDFARSYVTVDWIALAASSVDGLRLGLERLVRELDSLPADLSPYDRGRVAAAALTVLRRELFADLPDPFDLRPKLCEQAERDSPEQQSWAALIALHDHFRDRMRQEFLAALDSDPVHAPTLHRWLFLSLETSPSMLEHLFQRLRLLAQADADDRNLAALAVAYSGLGNVRYARALMNEAKERSVAEGQLAAYAQYVE